MNVAIIQARNGSERLRNKAILNIGSFPAFVHCYNRVRASNVDLVMVATTKNIEDDIIETICKLSQIRYYRGHSTDLLDRYYNAMKMTDASNVVRITADCPFIDPENINTVLKVHQEHGNDLTKFDDTLPDGFDVSVISGNSLAEAHRDATRPSEREHVTPFIENTFRYKTERLSLPSDNGAYRLTLDYQDDYIFMQNVHKILGDSFKMYDFIRLMKERPDLHAMVSHHVRNEKYIDQIARGE